jgi:hypothetical protein
MNNKIIKQQYANTGCDKLSNLHLSYGCIPFDQMPFNSSLKNHNPKLLDLFDSIDVNGREHEIFARFIKNNTEIKGQLYTPKQDIKGFENIEKLIELYNGSLYCKHTNRRLENYKNHIYIRDYEEYTHKIIEKLKELTTTQILFVLGCNHLPIELIVMKKKTLWYACLRIQK